MERRMRDGPLSLLVVTATGVLLAYLAWPTAERPAWHSAVYGAPAVMLLWSGIRGIVRTISGKRRDEPPPPC